MDLIAAALTGAVTGTLTSFGTFLVQERRLRTELRTEFMAETAIKALLEKPQWKLRSFSAIKRRFEGAFDENKMRELLVRSGAVRFERKDDGAELWGLLSKNEP